LFNGIQVENNESTDLKVQSFLKEHLKMEIILDDIDRSHRLNNNGPIIVKFVRHNIKDLIYRNKKVLKGKDYFISESLTRARALCVKELEAKRKKNSTVSHWTVDGEVY